MVEVVTTCSNCRVCGAGGLTELFSLDTQVVSGFFADAAELRNAPTCPITLLLCGECGLVQQKYTVPPSFLYTRHYWYRSGVTDTMRAALRDVVEDVCRVVPLRGGDVVLDIGANDGTLLSCYTTRGLCRVACEPAANLQDECLTKCEALISDLWSAEAYLGGVSRKLLPKVVTACGMFYDLEDPVTFVKDVAAVLHPDGVFVAQLQCLKQTVELGDVGNFCHEHLEFYSLEALKILYAAARLEIFDVTENAVNGGSYRVFARHAGSTVGDDRLKAGRLYNAERTEECMRLASPLTHLRLFNNMEKARRDCADFVRHAVNKGRSVYAYGASTKGNVILQYYGLGPDLVEAAADRSPEKWGRLTATGIPIVSEEVARTACPDYFLVLPYAFLNEFVEREKDQEWRKRGGKFLVPLPEFQIV